MVTHNWSHTAAEVVTGFILVAAFASVFTGLLGGSRVPHHAAQDGTFVRVFGRLHHKYEFPHFALLAMGGLHHRHVLQSGDGDRNAGRGVGTAAARRPGRRRHLAAPAPAALAPAIPAVAVPGPEPSGLGRWIYVFVSATSTLLIISSAWVVAGVVAFPIWAWVNRAWPFGPLEIRQQYLDEQRARQTGPAQRARDAVSA